MAEDKGYSAWLGILTLGVGIIIGGALVYIIIRKPSSLSTSTMYKEYQDLKIPENLGNIPQPVLSVHNDTVLNDIVHSDIEKTYKNNEKWQIERGPDGRIKSLNVIRDAKVN